MATTNRLLNQSPSNLILRCLQLGGSQTGIVKLRVISHVKRLTKGYQKAPSVSVVLQRGP